MKNDNDLRAFTTYFIAAVESLFPGTCRKTQTMINGPNLPQVADWGLALLNELDRMITGSQIGSHLAATLRKQTEGWVTGCV